jgi:rod shape-determining protein MreC
LAAFQTPINRPILSRGPLSLGGFLFFAGLSIVVMWLDQRHDYLSSVRRVLSIANYGVEVTVNSPFLAWRGLSSYFTTRGRLLEDNAALREHQRETDLKLQRFEALEQENLRLRGLRTSTERIAEKFLVAEIMQVDLDPYRHRVRINKGSRDGVQEGQPILDAAGVVGQITRVGVFSSEAILITDAEHAIPVQVNRNGLRTIAVGTGNLSQLALPYLASNADVHEGDLLVTSGLGGVFPAGYPVGTVFKIDRAAAQTLASIIATPAAALDRDREVLLVFQAEAPPEPQAATAPPAAGAGVKP